MKRLTALLCAFCAVVCIAAPGKTPAAKEADPPAKENTPPANLKYLAYVIRGGEKGSLSDWVKEIEKANVNRKNYRFLCSWEDIDSLLKALDLLMSSKTKKEALDAVEAIDSIATKQGLASRIALFNALSKDIKTPAASKEVAKHLDGIVESAFKKITTADYDEAVQSAVDILDGYRMWIDILRDEDVDFSLVGPSSIVWRSAQRERELPPDMKKTANTTRAAMAIVKAYSKLISAQNSGMAKKALADLDKAVALRERAMVSKMGNFSPAADEVAHCKAVISSAYVLILQNAEKLSEDGKVKKLIAGKTAAVRQTAKANCKKAIKVCKSMGKDTSGLEATLQGLEGK